MPKIAKFVMGNTKGKFQCKVLLISNENIQVTHNALEAVRVATNKVMQDNIGIENYMLWIKPYPHIVLRENKMIATAGADRLQEGMRRSFGKSVSRAARIKKGLTVIEIQTNKEYIDVARKALKVGESKISLQCKIEIREISELTVKQ